MPFQDAELDFRKGKRDQASRKLDEKRRALNAASEHRNLLKSMYDQKLNFYSSRIPSLKETIAYYRQESQTAYANRDGAAAKSWSDHAKQLRSELDEAYGEKNRMLEELKEAGARFRAALEEFREAQAEFNQARDSFNERLNILKEESARKRAERETEFKRQQVERQKDAEDHQRQQEQQKLLGLGKQQKLLRPSRVSWYHSSTDRDTGLDQTDWFEGWYGAEQHAHVAFDENGEVAYVRTENGVVLYNRKTGEGTLPSDLNWDKDKPVK